MVEPPYRIKNMMPGMIMAWHGSIATIPSGWHLCDGTAGTLDLRDMFVVGAGGAYAVGASGGAINHNHPFTGDGHGHDLLSGDAIIDSVPDGNYAHSTNTNPETGTTDSVDGRPPYYAFCWIEKL